MLNVGLKGRCTTVVTANNIARTMRSGDLEVFATPAMVALMEQAAMEAVAAELPAESTTVGAAMNCTHDRPTGLGMEVIATAELVAVEGRRLTFKVEAADAQGVIGAGEHLRYIVDRARFMAKVAR